MLDELLGEKIVVDCRAEFVILGTLKRVDEHWLELKNADLHDLRDTDSTRENYVVDSVRTGVKRNRKKLLVNRSDVLAVARLEDVADE